MDIHIYDDTISFDMRAAAVIIRGGSVLMVKDSAATSFYYSVGGGVKIGESTLQAAAREAFEETGVRFEIERLLYIDERFYENQYHPGKHHQLVFYYLMKPCDDSVNLSTDVGEALEWLAIDALAEYPLVPQWLAAELTALPATAKHIGTADFAPLPFELPDVHIHTEECIFNLCARAVIIRCEKVLAYTDSDRDYYSLPGGRIHIGETTGQAAAREALEETGVAYKPERLLFVDEWFNYNAALRQHHHNIAFYYLMLPNDAEPSAVTDNGHPLCWLPIDENATLYPLFIKERLAEPPETAIHIIHSED